MAKEKMTLRAYDWNTATSSLKPNPSDCRYEMPQSDTSPGGPSVNSAGMPITVKAYQEIIDRYRRAAATDNSIFSKLVNVTFSKASIFRILSQEGCEAIRIWQAIPNADGKVSLVLEGVDVDHKPLKIQNVLRTAEADGSERLHDEGDPIYEERGNGEEEGPGYLSQKNTEDFETQSLSDFMNELFTAFAKK